MPQFATYAPEACASCALGPLVIPDERGDLYQPGGVLVIGEAGGREEARERRPFVGESGHVLEALLKLAGLQRAAVYITNAVRHRPPANKTPTQAQVTQHRPFVEAAIADARPGVIIAVGSVALTWFRKTPSMTRCHGVPFVWQDIIVVPVFHPAFALRNPNIWPLIHSDFARVRDVLEHGLPSPKTPPNYRLGSESDAVAKAHTYRRIGFDLETSDRTVAGVFHPHLQEIVGYSVSWAAGESIYVPEIPMSAMRAVLEDARITKVCHNAKFEYQVLRNFGVTLAGFEDTKVKAYLLQHLSTHLKDLSLQLLGVEQLRLQDVTKGRPTVEVTPEEWLPYAAADADVTLQLDDILSAELEREGLTALYRDVELPLIPILAAAERRGGLIDRARFDELAVQLRFRRDLLHDELQQWFPGLNLNSFPQLTEVVFGTKGKHVEVKQELVTRTHIRYVPEGLGLKSRKKTPGGRLALDKEVLANLEGKHPAIKCLAEYHRLGDYLGDFVEKIPRLAVQGVLHTSINQAGTWEESGGGTKESPATGRLSSSGPNLMQIPKRDPVLAKAIRRGFVTRPGYVWLSADMRQQEPRIMALVSGDTQLQADFAAGVDVYMEIAHLVKQAVTHDPQARVVDAKERDRWGLEYRDTAKNKVFLPMQYGAGAAKLASIHPGLTIQSADVILRGLHDKYPKLSAYAAAQARLVEEHGYAVTLFGRKRWLPGIWAAQSRAEAARQGANHPVQGTGADILKGCLNYLWGKEGKLRTYDAHLLWPIHDSIDMEVRQGQLDAVVDIARGMTDWFTQISLPVEVSVGPSWGELKEVLW